jgi:hypothetical protein
LGAPSAVLDTAFLSIIEIGREKSFGIQLMPDVNPTVKVVRQPVKEVEFGQNFY